MAGFVGRDGGAIAALKSGDCREIGAEISGTAAVDTPRPTPPSDNWPSSKIESPKSLKELVGAVSEEAGIEWEALEIIIKA